jgi:hypothetical protein
MAGVLHRKSEGWVARDSRGLGHEGRASRIAVVTGSANLNTIEICYNPVWM